MASLDRIVAMPLRDSERRLKMGDRAIPEEGRQKDERRRQNDTPMEVGNEIK
jgi:hypothetical protein